MAKSWSLINRWRHPVLAVAGLLIAVAAAQPARADESRAWPGEFMRMGAGARALAMGNAYTAVEGDISSAYFNPAGLAMMERLHLTISSRYLSMDRRFMLLAFGGRIGPDADMAFSWIRAGTDGIIGRDLSGRATGTLADSRNALSLTFSRNLADFVAVGINTKMALWKLDGDDAKAFGIDLGVIVRPVNRLTVSVVVRDIGSRFTWNTGHWLNMLSGAPGQSIEKNDKFPLYYTVGAAWRGMRDRLTVSGTWEQVEALPASFNAGVAYQTHDRLTLRAGIYHYTFEDGLDEGSPTFGMTIGVTASTMFDYSYVPRDFTDDGVHSIALVMAYGG